MSTSQKPNNLCLELIFCLLFAGACDTSSSLNSADGMKSGVNVNMDMSRAQSDLHSKLQLNESLNSSKLTTLHASLEITTKEKSYFRSTIKNGDEIAIDLPLGEVTVRALVLAELRAPNWHDRCQLKSSDSREISLDHQENDNNDKNSRETIYGSMVSKKFTISEATESLDLEFDALSEVAMRNLLVKSETALPSGALIVYSDAVAGRPIIDPCTQKPYFAEFKTAGSAALAELTVPQFLNPQIDSADERPFSAALLISNANENQLLKWLELDPSLLQLPVLLNQKTDTPSSLAVLKVIDNSGSLRMPSSTEDSDGDGISNEREIALGSNPFVAPIQKEVEVELPKEGGEFVARIVTDKDFLSQLRQIDCKITQAAPVINASTGPTPSATALPRERLLQPINSFFTCPGEIRQSNVSGPIEVEFLFKDQFGLIAGSAKKTFSVAERITLQDSESSTTQPTTQPTAQPTAQPSPLPEVTFDSVAPVPGSGLNFGSTGPHEIAINWQPATDNLTPTQNLRYRLVYSTIASDLDTLQKAAALPASNVVFDWSSNRLSANVSGLNANTNYTFALLVRDAADNTFAYALARQTTALGVSVTPAPIDTISPTIGTPITTGTTTTNSVQILWGVASDNVTDSSNLYYKVVRSALAADLDTVSKALAQTGQNQVLDWTANITSATATGLSSGTSYAFAVVVKDGSGNSSLYLPTTFSTPLPATPAILSLENLSTGQAFGGLDGGSILRIRGSDFSDPMAVRVGGVACSQVSFITSAQIDCLLANMNAGTYSVTVTNADNTFATLSDSYIVLPGPAVSDISPDTVSDSGASVITLSGSGFLPGSTVLIGNLSCANITVMSPNALTCTAPPQAPASYEVKVIDPAGQFQISTIPLTYQASITALDVVSPAENELLSQFEMMFYGTCDSTGGKVTTASTIPANVKGVHIGPVNCSSNLLKFPVYFAAGSNPLLRIDVKTFDGGTQVAQMTRTVRFHRPCPEGYVGVAGVYGFSGSNLWNDPALNLQLGNAAAQYGSSDPSLDPGNDFCVMKYAAKASTNPAQSLGMNEPIFNGNQSFDLSKTMPISRPESTPLVNITQPQAIALCENLDMHNFGAADPTAGFGLISNTQWQVLARRIENTSSNWSNGSTGGVGSGKLPKGNSDNSINSDAAKYGMAMSTASPLALTSSRDDSRGMFGTGNSMNGAWWDQGTVPSTGVPQNRTFQLPDGSVIWDYSGNVWQWVKDPANGLGIPNTQLETNAVDGFQIITNPVTRSILAPFAFISSTANTGAIVGGIPGAIMGGTAGSVMRGGSWNEPNSGIYAANLNMTAAAFGTDKGMRCTYIPPDRDPSDTDIPEIISIERVSSQGTALSNGPVSIASGGNWNLQFNFSDISETNTQKLFVQVRRKISTSEADIPTLSDPVYRQGFGLNSLKDETSWNFDLGNSSTNSSKHVNYLVTVTDPSGNISDHTLPVSKIAVQVDSACPKGYVGVRGIGGGSTGTWNADSANLGLGSSIANYSTPSDHLNPGKDFCVMKYDAKAQTSPTYVEGGMQPIERADVLFSFSNVIPDSRASGRPWTNISSDEATAECNELDSVYFGTSIANSGFELISNTQWMVIARTLEATSSNWSTGTQGSGSLFKGNSFNGSDAEAERIGALLSGTTGFALASSQSDAKPYFGTGQSSGSTKRIFHLPNDQNIWDFSGNVWQWVKDSRTDLGIASSDESILSTAAVLSFQTSNTNTFSSQTNKIFGSFGTSGVQLPQTSSPGQILPGNGGAVARGGGYASGSETGLFATTLGWSPATRNSFAGFRCVYMPPPAPP